MADIQIESAVSSVQEMIAVRGGPFWTSTSVGYVIFANSGYDIVYRKTSDGGDNWAAAVTIYTGNNYTYDCWADWQTAGDTGTKIHVALIDDTGENIMYVYLDTDGDTVAGEDQIAGAGPLYSLGRPNQQISITKTRGGNIAVAYRYKDEDTSRHYRFYTSPDAATWTERDNPWESSNDDILLFPGNEADNQDIWAVFWDESESEISLKTYDDSGNSWSEQSISGSMAFEKDYKQMEGAVRLSDGHLILAAWNLFDDVGADLMVWDINGAGSITAKANVLTNSAESFLVSMLIDQSTDDIYVAYARGTSVGSAVKVYYKESEDGGGTWGGETAMQADAEDNEKWISCGAVKEEWGGHFMPIWYNDDLEDIFCNTDNAIEIAAPADPPTVTTQAADLIEATTARGNGNITDTGGENCDIRGIVWDLASHGDPGNVAPGASGYANDVPETDSFGIGPFTRSLTGLPTGDTIYCRAYAHNSAGYAYGAEVNFLTKPAAPVIIGATENQPDKVVVTWNKSTGATGYQVYRDGAPLGWLGDVATFDDNGADAPTITPGAAAASDGTYSTHVALSLAGEAANNGTTHTYKVRAKNATGESGDSGTDTGYRLVGALGFQWQRSAADSDAAYGNIIGATTENYNDTGAPANGQGRYYRCVLNADGAAEQISAVDRGYRWIGERSANMAAKMIAGKLI